MMKNKILMIAILVFLWGCSNPHNELMPKNLEDKAALEKMKPAIEKLEPEERELFVRYVIRKAFVEKLGSMFGEKIEAVPEGLTLGKAIESQRVFEKEQLEKKKKQEIESAAKKAKKEQERAKINALKEELSQLVHIDYEDIELKKEGYREKIIIAINVENRGSKTITGIKTILVFKDKFGDKINEMRIKVEEDSPGGKMLAQKFSRDYNQFMSNDRNLINSDKKTIVMTSAPVMILFEDGTKIEIPEDDSIDVD